MIRPLPFFDENLKSYLLSLAAANKAKNIYHVYKVVGLVKGNQICNLEIITDQSNSLEKLSKYTKINLICEISTRMN
ncbi:hypothetical protein IAQ67_14150 [Paenibacillus peoriae]|uniref:Uncharacterized protein n=1 Tax=Paenibacillus peoriae TaxID=59893 RepID=A0A7H0Y1W3_9BACL|nr:hypothetical protein IAQ67_14150 [Paenibacillus peoriae]